VTIMPCRAMDNNLNMPISGAIQCMEWCKTNFENIATMGGRQHTGIYSASWGTDSLEDSDALRAAIQRVGKFTHAQPAHNPGLQIVHSSLSVSCGWNHVSSNAQSEHPCRTVCELNVCLQMPHGQPGKVSLESQQAVCSRPWDNGESPLPSKQQMLFGTCSTGSTACLHDVIIGHDMPVCLLLQTAEGRQGPYSRLLLETCSRPVISRALWGCPTSSRSPSSTAPTRYGATRGRTPAAH
jgi:hypothetical protein